jgi:hypothetical protein
VQDLALFESLAFRPFYGTSKIPTIAVPHYNAQIIGSDFSRVVVASSCSNGQSEKAECESV